MNTFWKLTAKTNLHVGNENTTNYGLVDRSVQREALSGLPCIHSSSLKGAIKDQLAEHPELKDKAEKIFGSDKNGKQAEGKGPHIFFDAQLLSIPVQSDKQPFYRATYPFLLSSFLEKLTLFSIPPDPLWASIDWNDAPVVFSFAPGEKVMLGEKEGEGASCASFPVLKMIGEDVALFSDKDFKEICSDEELPIIARNQLKNGKSNMLWYEQVLPRETQFFTVIPGDDPDLVKLLKSEIIQIGANATIGYGYCKFEQL
ncbi:MAG: type III-B CRISPR module RAMP protein Cmr4 [Tannerellaceae bacterium]|nr:type III-B CRISPR module RAMP protein Cmr4 [Tannerellaceae bacterium]